MHKIPDRGRIVIVNFEQAGTAVPPEMVGTARPCLVIQNNSLKRDRLVTIVPLSTTAPNPAGKQHHLMSHYSFQGMPLNWGGQGIERWAKCDYVVTVSLERCSDPYSKPAGQARHYMRVNAAKVDLDAVDKCVKWALGIQ